MATRNVKFDPVTINGERHIDVVAAKNTKDCRGIVSCDVPCINPPLVNLQTKNIPTEKSINHVVRTAAHSVRPLAKKDGYSKDSLGQSNLPKSAAPVYGAAELHSTLRVGEALVKARNKKPGIVKLLEDKLQSPTTESRYKKKVSKGVTIPATKKVFSELVSLDVSEQTLAKQLDEQLQFNSM